MSVFMQDASEERQGCDRPDALPRALAMDRAVQPLVARLERRKDARALDAVKPGQAEDSRKVEPVREDFALNDDDHLGAALTVNEAWLALIEAALDRKVDDKESRRGRPGDGRLGWRERHLVAHREFGLRRRRKGLLVESDRDADARVDLLELRVDRRRPG